MMYHRVKTSKFYDSDEARVSGKYSYTESIDAFMDTAYQRAVLLSIDNPVMGFGGNGTEFVFDVLKPWAKERIDVAYPYDGQKNVGIDYYGKEVPNPLEQFGVEKTGYVISYMHPSGAWPDEISFSLVDSKGNDVPVYKEENWSGTNYYFPKEALKYSETYTASVKWFQEPNFSGGKTWSFTTKDAPKPKNQA